MNRLPTVAVLVRKKQDPESTRHPLALCSVLQGPCQSHREVLSSPVSPGTCAPSARGHRLSPDVSLSSKVPETHSHMGTSKAGSPESRLKSRRGVSSFIPIDFDIGKMGKYDVYKCGRLNYCPQFFSPTVSRPDKGGLIVSLAYFHCSLVPLLSPREHALTSKLVQEMTDTADRVFPAEHSLGESTPHPTTTTTPVKLQRWK